MLETTTTRHNPLIDPALHVWGWEIPVYLFVGGIVAGMMILAGIAMLRMAKGEDTRGFFSVQTPLLGFMLLNLGMGALLLDLSHKLYVWAVYLTFEPMSPMSWGSWVLIIVYGVLLVSALIRLPEAWPWLAQRVPTLQRTSDWMLDRPALVRSLAWTNIVLGVLLGIYTGILLNTMVARPLWNTSILAPLFLVSGLSAAAAAVHRRPACPDRPAPKSPLGGKGRDGTPRSVPAEKHTADSVIRDIAAVELLLIGCC
jgi:formate-dependent nitrite reductase membrane component NrfD